MVSEKIVIKQSVSEADFALPNFKTGRSYYQNPGVFDQKSK